MKLVLVPLCQIACAIQVFRRAVNVERDAGKCVTQPALNEADGKMCYVYADPCPAKLFGGMNRGSASAEWIEDGISLVAAGFDDPFK